LENTGSHYIFIASQPRSGSTLIQSILNNHPEICSLPEPWILLHALSPISASVDGIKNQVMADYIQNFIAAMPENTYQDAIRQMSAHLYDEIIKANNASFFVDKTPRYYLIVKEIRELFPEALIILQIRNPLAALISMVKRKGHQRINLIFNREDLLDAPGYLIEAMERDDENLLVFHYEALVKNPEKVATVYQTLGLEIPENMEQISPPVAENAPNPQAGDHKIQGMTEVDDSAIDSWQKELKNPQMWRFAYDYLNYLGEDCITRLGYDYQELQAILEKNRPAIFQEKLTIPLLWLFSFENTVAVRKTWRYRLNRFAARIVRS